MMLSNRVPLTLVTAVLALWLLAEATPARADLRVNDLDIYLNDHEVTVHVVLLGTIPPGFQEGLQSGIPAHVRYTVELWQYNRLWRDALIKSVTIGLGKFARISSSSDTSLPHRVLPLRGSPI